MSSGVKNFICVAAVLHSIGLKGVGVRLDSGDLAYLSKKSKEEFKKAGNYLGIDFSNLIVVASDDVNEGKLKKLKQNVFISEFKERIMKLIFLE